MSDGEGGDGRLLASRVDGERHVLTAEYLLIGQRLEVAGAETVNRVRDGSQAAEADEVCLRLAALYALRPLHWNTELHETLVRPAADFVTNLHRSPSLACVRITAAAEQQ